MVQVYADSEDTVHERLTKEKASQLTLKEDMKLARDVVSKLVCRAEGKEALRW
jgi:hypothetical protein